jgi:hypothetical protein
LREDWRAIGCDAATLSTENTLKINYLQRRPERFAAISCAAATIGAPVELSGRASLGFADD